MSGAPDVKRAYLFEIHFGLQQTAHKSTKMKKVIILGAAGRDFHNFNVFFRNNKAYKVVAFTMAQLPVGKRTYPPILAGKLYPKGIPIYPESKLTELIKKFKVDVCVLAYSDLSYNYVMRKGAEVQAAGADFWLLGPRSTMLKSKKQVISVCAVRTGCGKSQTSRKIVRILREAGKKVVVIRHPMPYGDLSKQIVQRFASFKDLDKQKCTIEEREDYEPHIAMGSVVYAGVDYEKILRRAEKEADIIVWDGGNNDFPFIKPDLHIVVADPHRPGHEISYYPGEINARMADVIIINKVDTAKPANVKVVEQNIKKVNPKAKVIKAASPISVDKPELIRNKRVLIVEDGPTLTHGEMPYGAGTVAAKKFRAKAAVDPKKYFTPSFKRALAKYPHLEGKKLLPAIGYSKTQINELQKIINRTPADAVILGTPTDLSRYLKLNKPAVHVKYELEELTKPGLKQILSKFIKA